MFYAVVVLTNSQLHGGGRPPVSFRPALRMRNMYTVMSGKRKVSKSQLSKVTIDMRHDMIQGTKNLQSHPEEITESTRCVILSRDFCSWYLKYHLKCPIVSSIKMMNDMSF